VPADDAANVGQADAGPLEIVGAVQALERAEQPGRILHVEADTVVAHPDDRLLLPFFRPDRHVGHLSRPGVLEGVR